MRRLAVGGLLAFVAGVSQAELLVVNPYSLSDSDRAALVAAATREAAAEAPVANVFAFENKDISAEILFGPYDWGTNTFSLDVVRCSKASGKWKCESRETRSFMHSGDISTAIRVDKGVSLDMARTIAAYVHPKCEVPKVLTDGPHERRALLWAPTIYKDSKTGHYWRDSGSCAIELDLKDGRVRWAEMYDVLE